MELKSGASREGFMIKTFDGQEGLFAKKGLKSKHKLNKYGIDLKVLENIGKYDFILINFANADLVGHSGKFEAMVKACEVVDECVGKIVDNQMPTYLACTKQWYLLFFLQF